MIFNEIGSIYNHIGLTDFDIENWLNWIIHKISNIYIYLTGII